VIWRVSGPEDCANEEAQLGSSTSETKIVRTQFIVASPEEDMTCATRPRQGTGGIVHPERHATVGRAQVYTEVPQNILRNAQNKNPESIIATGNVSTHAINRFRTVPHCNPE